MLQTIPEQRHLSSLQQGFERAVGCSSGRPIGDLSRQCPTWSPHCFLVLQVRQECEASSRVHPSSRGASALIVSRHESALAQHVPSSGPYSGTAWQHASGGRCTHSAGSDVQGVPCCCRRLGERDGHARHCHAPVGSTLSTGAQRSQGWPPRPRRRCPPPPTCRHRWHVMDGVAAPKQ